MPDTLADCLWRWNGRVTWWLAPIAAAALALLAAITFCDVVARYFFNAPFSFTVEITGGTVFLPISGFGPSNRNVEAADMVACLATDLVVPTWSAAFVWDTDVGTRGVLEILEFSNSQLLEFRYYDQLLDSQLEAIYRKLQKPGWLDQWIGGRYTRAARQVHRLFIDVNELTDKTENALKIAGDVYAARLFTLVGARLGLDQWKANVRDKLKTLDDIYRFAVEQTAMARGELLELMIVAILVFELVLFFAGIMR